MPELLEPFIGKNSGAPKPGKRRQPGLPHSVFACPVGVRTDDSRVDLVVTQNASVNRLFLNRQECNGLRVRFEDESKGVGVCSKALLCGGHQGTDACGAGRLRLSIRQNATTQVLGAAREAVAIEVAWPSEEIKRVQIEPGRAEVVVNDLWNS
jgi:hypothetical protein